MGGDSVSHGKEALAQLIYETDRKMSGEETVRLLMEAVGSIKSIYEMNRDDLQTEHGIPKSVSEMIDLIDDIGRCVLRDNFPDNPMIANCGCAAEYLQALMYGRHVEYCYLMLLDAKGRMIACPLMQRGTIDRSAVYARELALKAIRLKAKYAVMAHNHPGGTLEASQADVKTTHAAMEAMNAVNVVMLDHLIIAGREYTSIRKAGTPAEKIWQMQNPKDKLLLTFIKTNAPEKGGRK